MFLDPKGWLRAMQVARSLFQCSRCRAPMKAPELDATGANVVCPRCGNVTPVKSQLQSAMSSQWRQWLSRMLMRSPKLSEDQKRRWRELLQ